MDTPAVTIIDIDEDAPEVIPEPDQLPALTIEFLLGGHAYFSVVNPKGQRFSYVIKARRGKPGTKWSGTTSYYLRVFLGGAYRYVGVVNADTGEIISTGK